MKRLRVINTETGEDWSERYTLRHRNQNAAFRQQQEKQPIGAISQTPICLIFTKSMTLLRRHSAAI
ncbi:hypothetical protein [Bacillus velezensis]|uniref:hypothetical protein n=1 Tax=Bacillus velezensis TaxID=492670 RepID=UPI001E5A0220|nr:hypothetical protein [Bacillus velezensis]